MRRNGEWNNESPAHYNSQFRHSARQSSSKPSKPNTLPVLNCLFSALKSGGGARDKDGDGREGDGREGDETPYMEIPVNG